MKTATVFDCDGTLFNSDSFKENYLTPSFKLLVGEENVSKVWKLYDDVKKESEVKVINYSEWIQKIADEFEGVEMEKVRNILEQAPFEAYLYEGAKDLVRMVKENGSVGILSLGNIWFQRLKIKKSGLEELFIEDSVRVTEVDKLEDIESLTKKLIEDGVERIIIVDDDPRFLKKVSELNLDLKLVWVKQGRYAEEYGELLKDEDITEVRSLTEAKQVLFEGSIKAEKAC